MFAYIKQLTKESAIYGLSKAIIKMAAIFLVPLYTHFFSPADYGILSIISNGIFLVTIFAALGLETASGIFFWKKNSCEEQKKIIATWFWAQTLFSVFLFAIIFIFNCLLSEILFHSAEANAYIMLGAGILVCSLPAEVCLNWFRLQRKAGAAFIFSVFIFMVTVLLNVFFVVKMEYGLTGIFLSQLLTGIIGTVVAVATMADWINFRYFNFIHLKEMLKFSYPLIPASLAFWLLNSSAVYFISFFLDTADSGMYQVGSTLAAGMGIFISAFQMAWGPFALSIQNNKDARQVYALVFRIYAAVSTCFAVFMFLFSKEILIIFTTENYYPAHTVAGILGFGIIAGGYIYIASIGLNIVKTSVPYSIAVVSSALLTIILFTLLIKPLGIEGAALSAFAGQLIVPVFLFFKAQQKYPVPYNFSSAIRMSGSGVMLCIIYYFGGSNFGIIMKALFFIVFVGLILLMNKNVIQNLRKKNS